MNGLGHIYWGTNDIENLAAACVECNAGKSDGGAAE